MRPITSTYRLQLHRDFPLAAARAIVPYLKRLGVSHLYLSPVTSARAGSMHGYDVTDYAKVNPELGGRAAFNALARAARDEGLGLILDIVPNHMASAVPENAWWSDVLARGAKSPYANTFDIDWAAARERLSGKILLPILGTPYAQALENGDLRLEYDENAGRFEIRYFTNRLPLAPESGPHPRASSDDGFAFGRGARSVRATLEAHAPATPEGRASLNELLDKQHYRLAYWKLARDEINWRRFFEISDLVGVRVERRDVFEATHALVFELYEEGVIDGVRVDHIDGLADPSTYCRRLVERLLALNAKRSDGGIDPPYVVVEKILAQNEQLERGWAVAGTTGYDFMNQVLGLLVDTSGQGELDELWKSVSGSTQSFDEIESEARLQILDENLRSEFVRAVTDLARLAAGTLATRDVSRAALERASRALLTALRVYRTYAYGRRSDVEAQPALIAALERAYAVLDGADHAALGLIGDWMSGRFDSSISDADAEECTARFEQLAAPLAAKSVEDTAFYRYGRLVALNEVGASVAHFGLSLTDFHAAMKTRALKWPTTMNATATHDHKRGEDLRARLAVLSEIPGWWSKTVRDWRQRAVAHRASLADSQAPDAADEAMLFQMLVGAWPLSIDVNDPDARQRFIGRLSVWQDKAVREAKRHGSWLAPALDYEESCRRFLQRIGTSSAPHLNLVDVADAARHIDACGALNGLSQAFLRMTAPGVPDLYQGCERWDFSLVDPDNRGAVDYALRKAALDDEQAWSILMQNWRDGRIKQDLIRQTLAARAEYPDVFLKGSYEALPVSGPNHNALIAFRRRSDSHQLIAIATRLAYRLVDGEPHVDPARWAGERVPLEDAAPRRWRDLLTGVELDCEDGSIAIRAALARLPVSLLLARTDSGR